MPSKQQDFFPIKECYVLAVCELGIQPESFWSMGYLELLTIAEVREKYLSAINTDVEPPNIDELQELIKKFG